MTVTSASLGGSSGWGPEGLLVFAQTRMLLGTTPPIALQGTRDVIRRLRAEAVEVAVLTPVSERGQLAELTGVHWVDAARGAADVVALARGLDVPYWRTAAVGDSGADLPVLEAASLPFWLGCEPYPGRRGAVHLPPGAITTVAERVLSAWLPDLPAPRSPAAVSFRDHT